MVYENILPGIFRKRPNRFIAEIEIEGELEICHVKNTGRCRELLIDGAQVFVQKSGNPLRKTRFDLIAVQKGEKLINMDSQVPNRVFAQWLESSGFIPDISLIRPETVFGNSRFDFYIEAEKQKRKIFIEVKGVTLEQDGVVLFPDAPTLRGVKHLEELTHCLEADFEAMMVFIIQMRNVKYFCPNDETHPAFGAALREAKKQGVQVLALDCNVSPDSITAADFVEIRL